MKTELQTTTTHNLTHRHSILRTIRPHPARTSRRSPEMRRQAAIAYAAAIEVLG